MFSSIPKIPEFKFNEDLQNENKESQAKQREEFAAAIERRFNHL